MFPDNLIFDNFAAVTLPLAGILAIFTAIFLFWRSGRHELFDSDLLFDTIFISFFGGLILGRVFEFIFNVDRFGWSFSKLIFFNTYSGFDVYGFLLGMVIFGGLFLRKEKINFFSILDLAAAPLAMASAIIALGYAASGVIGKQINVSFLKFLGGHYPISIFYAVGYFLIFIIVKRLAVKKRHPGYFFCFFLVSFSILDLILFQLRNERTLILGNMVYQLLMPLLFLTSASLCWYFLARRKIIADIKSFFALILLIIFSAKRALTNINEAGGKSKAVVLLPYFLLRSFIKLLRLIWREISLAFWEFLTVLGVKR